MGTQSRADRAGAAPDPRRNALLARLPADEYERVTARLALFTPQIRYQVYRQEGQLDHVYFPLDAVFSLVTTTGDGTVEVATIGNEGILGLPAYLGSASSPDDVFCQIPGRALSMPITDLRQLLTGGDVCWLLRLHTQATFIQMSQNIACNQLHSAAQRAARWLLMTHDRAAADEFTLTHEFLAQMLGVRRATVTDTAGHLRARGLIDYRRGRITILSRAALESAACECYRRVRDKTEQLLGARR